MDFIYGAQFSSAVAQYAVCCTHRCRRTLSLETSINVWRTCGYDAAGAL
jgi:hypothetical protein